jgi:hypothetical protein
MGSGIQELKYEGDVLTDITSFSMVQNILDGNNKTINYSQVESLESIIQLLVFFDNIWIVEPSMYGVDFGIEGQGILTSLLNEDIIKSFPPKLNSDHQTDFKTQYREIEEIISTSSAHPSFDEYYHMHTKIAHDLKIYDDNFALTKNPKAIELAKMAKLNPDYIPLCANLLRCNYYFKLIQQMRSEEGKLFTYCPNSLRTSLVEDIISHQNTKISNHITKILQEHLNSIKISENERRKHLAQRTFSDYTLELPLLTSIIVNECKNRNDFFDTILKWRNDRSAERIRSWLKKVQDDISNERMTNLTKHIEKMDESSESLGVKSSNKAKFVSCLTDTSLLEGSAQTMLTGNPLPAAAGASKSFGEKYLIPYLNLYLNRDLFLFLKMKREAQKISFNKEKFDRLFNVKLQL